MENKLISLTEFVNRIDELVPAKDYEMDYDTNSSQLNAIKRYAKFLSQPLTLSMFVPCDDEGNVLEEPYIQRMYHMVEHRPYSEIEKEYNNAKEKVLFEGWTMRNKKKNMYMTIVYNDDYEINLDTLSTEWMVEGGSFSGRLIGNTLGQVADQFKSIILSATALEQIYG